MESLRFLDLIEKNFLAELKRNTQGVYFSSRILQATKLKEVFDRVPCSKPDARILDLKSFLKLSNTTAINSYCKCSTVQLILVAAVSWISNRKRVRTAERWKGSSRITGCGLSIISRDPISLTQSTII